MMARPARCGASEAEGLRRLRGIERRRLSRALHDQAAPLLCSAGLLAELLRGTIPSPTPQQEQILADLLRALESAVEHVRQLSHEAAPDLGSRRSLADALDLLARAYGADRPAGTAPELPAVSAQALCELVRDALLACEAGSGSARIHASPAGIRIEAACEADEDVLCALETGARNAGLDFTLQRAAGATTIGFYARERG